MWRIEQEPVVIPDEAVAGGWGSYLQACGPLLQTPGLDRGDSSIRGSTGLPQASPIQSVRVVALPSPLMRLP